MKSASCPCGCYVDGSYVSDRRVKHWKILRVLDRGPTHHYRYQVEGVNLYCEPERYGYRFSWAVPDIVGEQYDLTTAVRVQS